MIEIDKLTGRQIAAARTLIGMSQPDLAEAASISVPTLRRMEGSAGAVSGLKNNIRAVLVALEAAGVVVVGDGDTTVTGAGVRLKD